MKLSFNIKGDSIVKLFKHNLSIVLWAFLLVVALMTGWIIWGELSKISQVRTDNAAIQSKIVRLNLAKYRELEARLDENARFQPQPVPRADAFSAAPQAKQ